MKNKIIGITMSRIDKKFEKLGFAKILENKFGVEYNKYIEEFDYNHVIQILHKKSGKHIIQSYQTPLNSDGFNNCVGMTFKETKLTMKKFREMKRKYRW